MARKLFIAATGQHCGKTTTSLAVLHLARRKYRQVGFLKPFGAKVVVERGLCVDKDVALMAEVYGLRRHLRWMSPVVVHPDTTHRVVDGEIAVDRLYQRILTSFEELEKRCDFLIIEGSGHPGVGSVMQLSNARVAAMLRTPVLLVTGGGLGKVVDDVHLSLPLFQQEQAEVRALLVNKIIPEKRERMLDYLQRAMEEEGFVIMGGMDWEPVLSNPTLIRLSSILDLPLHGNRRDANRVIHNIQVGMASPERVVEHLKEHSLLIITSNRDDILVTLAHLYQTPEYRRRIVGLIINGLHPVNAITRRILEASRMPYFRTQCHSAAELLKIIHGDVAKITATDREKLEKVRALAEKHLDLDAIERICG